MPIADRLGRAKQAGSTLRPAKRRADLRQSNKRISDENFVFAFDGEDDALTISRGTLIKPSLREFDVAEPLQGDRNTPFVTEFAKTG